MPTLHSVRCIALALAVALPGLTAVAAAQSARTLPSIDQPSFKLDLPKATPSHRTKPPAAVVSSQDAERAARLSEARRKFFAPPLEEPESRHVGDFGGYDYRRDSGTHAPGFRF